jgi:hypothetical protein
MCKNVERPETLVDYYQGRVAAKLKRALLHFLLSSENRQKTTL